MKILTISDNVLRQLENAENLKRQYGDAEMLISCGDMPPHYLDFIATTLNLPLFFVRGNHDIQYEENPPGGDDLNLKVRRFKGLVFAGLEGCIRYNREPIQYTEDQMFFMVIRLWQQVWFHRLRHGFGLDVLVTHSPPRGIHDMTDRAHLGFRSLRLALNLFKPRYMIHGHVDTHDSRRPTRTTLGETDIININPVKVLTIEPRPRPGKSG